jgi:hypothetical protein
LTTLRCVATDVIASGWDRADDLAGHLDRIRAESGPDAIGIFFGTGSSFDAAGGRVAAAFHHALGSHSRYTARTIDTPCRPLVSDLMGGHPSRIPAIDHDNTTLLVFVGTNPVVSHGHLASLSDPVVRLRRLTSDGREVWVLDPAAPRQPPRTAPPGREARRRLRCSAHTIPAACTRASTALLNGAPRAWIVRARWRRSTVTSRQP